MDIKNLLTILGVSEDEALQAIISAVTPLQPGVLRQNWSRLSTFGNTAPSTQDIWKKFEESDFRCSNCGSQLRITLDHKDGNSTNHRLENIQVLCFVCNRKKAKKGVQVENKTLRVVKAVMAHFKSHRSFPSRKQIIEATGIKSLPTYLLKYLEKRLTVAYILKEETDGKR
jgi:hypothetical protein